jgi:hypothetical protein
MNVTPDRTYHKSLAFLRGRAFCTTGMTVVLTTPKRYLPDLEQQLVEVLRVTGANAFQVFGT